MNLLFGVGVGDVRVAFDRQYEIMNTQLKPEFRFRAHNQYLTFFITFGVIGGIWFILTLVYPLFLKKHHTYLYIVFFAIMALSFVSEDTLETQAGVTLFAVMNSLLLFSRPHERFQ